MKIINVHLSISEGNHNISNMMGFNISVAENKNVMILYEEIEKKIKEFDIQSKEEGNGQT